MQTWNDLTKHVLCCWNEYRQLCFARHSLLGACGVYCISLTVNAVFLDQRESSLRDWVGWLPTTRDDSGRCNCPRCFISRKVEEFVIPELIIWEIMEKVWFQQDNALIRSVRLQITACGVVSCCSGGLAVRRAAAWSYRTTLWSYRTTLLMDIVLSDTCWADLEDQ
jgi:hypothetical protein